MTILTEAMIDSFPAVDVHVHVPGTIAPQTAWELGLRNKLIHMEQDAEGRWMVVDGPNAIGASDPVKQYSHIFCSKGPKGPLPLNFDQHGKPINLDYDYDCVKGQDGKHDTFKGFDAIQGTTQGHRHRPGGIQNEDDYRLVMQRYLESCQAQHIRYTEASQNITIAQVLYPTVPPQEARRKFFHLCRDIVATFAAGGVDLRFYHCANKTAAANVATSLKERAHEWADWLEEAQREVPGVFVGLTTAGHEKMEIAAGGPGAMVEAYRRVEAMGLGCEGHYGEGAGVEHMTDALECLPKTTRYAHGIQMIESPSVIDEVRARGIPLIMMPCININLGGVIHYKDGKPHPKLTEDRSARVPGIENHYIEKLEDHPFFTLMREHRLPIALASDDPQQGGIPYKAQIRQLAGFDYVFPKRFPPLTAEELARCNLNAIHVAFCDKAIKKKLTTEIRQWMHTHGITIEHPLLTCYKDASPPGEDD